MERGHLLNLAVLVRAACTTSHRHPGIESPVSSLYTGSTGLCLSSTSAKPVILGYGTFRLNFHHFDHFDLDLRGHNQVRGAAFSCPRLELGDMVLIRRFFRPFLVFRSCGHGNTSWVYSTASRWLEVAPGTGARGGGTPCLELGFRPALRCALPAHIGARFRS